MSRRIANLCSRKQPTPKWSEEFGWSSGRPEQACEEQDFDDDGAESALNISEFETGFDRHWFFGMETASPRKEGACLASRFGGRQQRIRARRPNVDLTVASFQLLTDCQAARKATTECLWEQEAKNTKHRTWVDQGVDRMLLVSLFDQGRQLCQIRADRCGPLSEEIRQPARVPNDDPNMLKAASAVLALGKQDAEGLFAQGDKTRLHKARATAGDQNTASSCVRDQFSGRDPAQEAECCGEERADETFCSSREVLRTRLMQWKINSWLACLVGLTAGVQAPPEADSSRKHGASLLLTSRGLHRTVVSGHPVSEAEPRKPVARRATRRGGQEVKGTSWPPEAKVHSGGSRRLPFCDRTTSAADAETDADHGGRHEESLAGERDSQTSGRGVVPACGGGRSLGGRGACVDSSELSPFCGSPVSGGVRWVTSERFFFFLAVRQWQQKSSDRILGCHSWEMCTWRQGVSDACFPCFVDGGICLSDTWYRQSSTGSKIKNTLKQQPAHLMAQAAATERQREMMDL